MKVPTQKVEIDNQTTLMSLKGITLNVEPIGVDVSGCETGERVVGQQVHHQHRSPEKPSQSPAPHRRDVAILKQEAPLSDQVSYEEPTWKLRIRVEPCSLSGVTFDKNDVAAHVVQSLTKESSIQTNTL